MPLIPRRQVYHFRLVFAVVKCEDCTIWDYRVSDEPKSLFETFGQRIVPLVATIGALLSQKQKALALTLGAVAIVSLCVSEIPSLFRWLKKRRARKQEEKIAAQAQDELKVWIQKFLEFATVSTSDSFSGIVWTRLCGSNMAHFESLHIPPLPLFADFARILALRTDAPEPSRDALKLSTEELNSLVGLYCRFCVCPVYERVPVKLKPEVLKNFVDQNLEQDFIQFRERYDRFLEDYMAFLKALDRKLPNPLEPRPFGYYFERPKPLAHAVKSQSGF